MIDIAAYELNKFYGSNHVLKGVTFEVYTGEKIGLLGKNGSGKTTLFKVITGEETYESGSISKASGKKIEMLAQIFEFGNTVTTENILRSSFSELTSIFMEMIKIENENSPSAFTRYGHLLEEYERLGGYETEVKMDKVCNGMNIDERMRKSIFNQLSGGEKTRVNLARILLRDCDVLLLDEPTNHLDLAALEWLEGFLSDFPGTVVVISHDRMFLDRVVTRIIEIEDGKANFYSGNYSFYVEEREQRFLTQTEQYRQQQRKISQLETAIKRQRVWATINPSNTGLAKRALAMEKRLEQMEKVDKPVRARTLTAEFDSGGYASKEIVSFNSVCKNYGSKVILNNLNLKIFRKDCIALVGANGCGKSTLLKMMMSEEPCDSGEIKVAPSVKTAYMAQIIEFENANATVLATLRSAADLSEEKTRSVLAGFNFRATDVAKKVGALSGGEKSRLKLCLLMQNNVNFLLLDEPTNHLDIASREWIENALSDFEGTMLFVSHDRFFLNKFAVKVWSMDNGVIAKYDYGYEEYLDTVRPATSKKVKNKSTEPKEKPRSLPEKSAPRSVSTEELISEAESELKNVNAEIEYHLQKSDYQKMNELYDKKSQLTERIDSLYNDWFKESE